MKNSCACLGLIAALATLAACTTPAQRGTEVTRFHVAQPFESAMVSIEPSDPAQVNSLEYRQYAALVSAEMSRHGFTTGETAETEFVIRVDVSRGTREEAARRSPFSIGIGGGSFGRRSGIGLGTSFGVGGSRGGEVTVTQLDVSIVRRADETALWEGRATRVTEPGTESPASIVQRLAQALFQDFPGESGSTITVE